jgi:OHCU decarboxylase
MIAPGSLEHVLHILASERGIWTPVAGGTEVMVQFGAGKLPARRFINIANIPQLRQIRSTSGELHIGAGSTYADIRRDATIRDEFPLLATAASWTGSIANQNRGTLGGNIVNASPAADSLPALLVYEAELLLVSSRGERRVPYTTFHTGYKKMHLEPDELIRTIILPRRYVGWIGSARKVGPRNAQAISKLCMAVLARVSGRKIEEIRIAFGSMAPVPLRLSATEKILSTQTISNETIRKSRNALASEVLPIDDIRSTREYRIGVAGNLLEEFLRSLNTGHPVLSRWNNLPADTAARELLSCCGSYAWARAMTAARPFLDEARLFTMASEIWRSLPEADWMEAFRNHPRIGERHAERATTTTSARWSAGEQDLVTQSDNEIRGAIAEGNRCYEDHFGRIYIVCASDKTPMEILSILNRRLKNDDATEMKESAEQQEQIMQLRLRRWIATEATS